MEPAEPNLIRKMGLFESDFHTQVKNMGLINATSLLVASQIDLFANLDLINKSIRIWKRTQPLLCSKVILKSDKNDKEKQNTGSYYFAYADEDSIEKMNNVSYLYYKKPPNDSGGFETVEDCKDLWNLLVERELNIPINWQNGLMWRLIFISTKRDHDAKSYEYRIIITLSHAIFDGTSRISAIYDLFRIVEKMFVSFF